LLGFEATCEAEPAFWLDGENEAVKEDVGEPWVLPPAPPDLPGEPFRPFREDVWPGWSRTTDEKGAPAR
jgi:hypothetical protein